MSRSGERNYGLPLSPLLVALLWTAPLWTVPAFAKITPFLPQVRCVGRAVVWESC